MVYKIIDIEGVGEVYAEKLIAAGIKDTDALLEKCAKPAGRKELEKETEISGKLILKWTNHADLMRINGVGPQLPPRTSSTVCLHSLKWRKWSLKPRNFHHSWNTKTATVNHLVTNKSPSGLWLPAHLIHTASTLQEEKLQKKPKMFAHLKQKY